MKDTGKKPSYYIILNFLNFNLKKDKCRGCKMKITLKAITTNRKDQFFWEKENFRGLPRRNSSVTHSCQGYRSLEEFKNFGWVGKPTSLNPVIFLPDEV